MSIGFQRTGMCLVAIALAALVAVNSARAEMITPVVHLTFEDTLTNSGSNGNLSDGTEVGTATAGTGDFFGYEAGAPLGKGYRLGNPANLSPASGAHYIKVPYVLPDDGTLAFWVKPENITTNSWYMSLFDNSVSSNDWEMWLAKPDTTYRESARFRPKTGATYFLSPLPTAPDGDTWYHIAVTWDRQINGTDVDVAVYINGVKASIPIIPTGGTSFGTWTNPGSYFQLGGGSSSNRGAIATFDDLRIYNQTLTAAQVAEVYSIPEPGSLMLLVSALLAFGIRGRKAA